MFFIKINKYLNLESVASSMFKILLGIIIGYTISHFDVFPYLIEFFNYSGLTDISIETLEGFKKQENLEELKKDTGITKGF